MDNLIISNKTFTDTKHLRESVLNLLLSLNDKVDNLNTLYKDLIEKNIDETKNGLDSLHFQSKIMDIELENNQKIFTVLENRIYGDYYKLYKKMVKFMLENIKNKNITNAFERQEFQIYNDLDITQCYNFETTKEIYTNINQIFDILNTEFETKNNKFQQQQIKRENGLHIEILLNDINYNNTILKNNISLFSEYLSVYNNLHNKFLTRFYIRIKLFYGQINSDLHLEEIKNNLSHNIDIEADITINQTDEDKIRFYINDPKYINTNNIVNELDNMLSGINNPPSNRSSPVKLDKCHLSNSPPPKSPPSKSKPDRQTSPRIILYNSTDEKPILEKQLSIEPIPEKQQSIEPIIEKPIIEKQLSIEPILEKPIIEKQLSIEPITEEPILEEPILEEPILEESIPEKQVLEEPILEESISIKLNIRELKNIGSIVDVSIQNNLINECENSIEISDNELEYNLNKNCIIL